MIVPYDPAWPARFEAEAARIRQALGVIAVRVDHIGSTAVPGLAAKDIVDIQVSLRSLEPEAPYRVPLEGVGYVHGPDDEAAHRFFKRNSVAGRRLVNLHVCEAGGNWESRHLAFRDRLRERPDVAARYEQLKRDLAQIFPSRGAYTEAKTAFIRSVVRDHLKKYPSPPP
ncbi:MAG: GrpB family protein [Candidatus Dormibacteraeota bacterium]|nr:GrpB family protein [Candidatus Dormibacteraeota bacterium]